METTGARSVSRSGGRLRVRTWSAFLVATLFLGFCFNCSGHSAVAPKLLPLYGDTVEAFKYSRHMYFVPCSCGDSLQVTVEDAPRWVRLEQWCDTLYRLIINAPEENNAYYTVKLQLVDRDGQIWERDSVVVYVRRPYARFYIIENPRFWRALLKHLDVGDLVVVRGDSFPRLTIEGLRKKAVYIRPESGYKGRIRGFDIYLSSGIDIAGFEFVRDTNPAVFVGAQSSRMRFHHNVFHARMGDRDTVPALQIQGSELRVDFNAHHSPLHGADLSPTVKVEHNYRLCAENR